MCMHPLLKTDRCSCTRYYKGPDVCKQLARQTDKLVDSQTDANRQTKLEDDTSHAKKLGGAFSTEICKKFQVLMLLIVMARSTPIQNGLETVPLVTVST